MSSTLDSGWDLAAFAHLQATPIPSVLHRGGKVLRANAAAQNLFGFASSADMQGFDVFAGLSGAELSAFSARRHAEYAQCTVGQPTPWVHYRLRTRMGTWRDLAITCSQIECDGEMVILSLFIDQTSDSIIDRALGNSHEVAVVMTDEVGRVVWANPASERLTGYSCNEMVGRSPGSILQFEDTDKVEVARLSRHIRAGSAVVCELLNRHKKGHHYWVRLQLLPAHAPDGRLIGHLALQTDVTVEVTRRREQAALLDQRLSTFSHEARTPLNAVLNLLDMMQHTDDTLQQREWLQHAVRAATVLKDLTDSLLDAGRQLHFNQQRPPVPTRLQDLMSQLNVVAAGYPRGERVQLTFVSPPEVPTLLMRPDLLLRVLMNLLSNALKYTHEGSVVVRVEMARQAVADGSALLRFSVTDTGLGVAPQDQARIFQAFETVAHAQTHGQGSTGLGLALCESMLRSVGSSLRLHSQVGSGSCFSFELSCAVAPQGLPLADQRPDAKALTGLRVLVVDDDPVNLLVAQVQMQRLGAVVQTAPTPDKAREYLVQQGPGQTDLVLMDLQMPHMSGEQAAAMILALPGFEQQAIVALSGEIDPESVEAALAAGMVDFIAKPFDAATLNSKLSRYKPRREALTA